MSSGSFYLGSTVQGLELTEMLRVDSVSVNVIFGSESFVCSFTFLT